MLSSYFLEELSDASNAVTCGLYTSYVGNYVCNAHVIPTLGVSARATAHARQFCIVRFPH